MSRPVGSGGFRWVSEPWGDALVCEPLGAVAPHVFTSRQLELRGTTDATAREWAAIGQGLGVAGTDILRVHQVHGADVIVVRAGGGRPWPPDAPPRADILIADDPTMALSVRAADCVPILIADRRTGAVAAVHAGWRGTCASAGPAAVRALEQHFGARPTDLIAAIGPSIGPCCYEVGSKVVDAFAGAGHPRHHITRWFPTEAVRGEPRTRMPIVLDLWAANCDQLVLAGIPEGQVHVAALCTATHNDTFFSYRREGEAAGRMAAVIRRRA